MKQLLVILAGLTVWSGSVRAQRTWQPRESHTRDSIRAIAFLDELVGFACADTILQTSDQGATWAAVGRKRTYVGIERVSGDIIAISREGLAVRTSDQGITWETRAIQLSNIEQTAATSRYIYAAGGRQVTRSNDRGVTWEKMVVGIQEARDISFADANRGFIIGRKAQVDLSRPAAAQLFITSDAGDTWTEQYTGIDSELFGLFAFDKANLIAVGAHGTVWRSADAGREWRVERIDSSVKRFNKVAFRTRLEGIIVGSEGVIYATSDGGLTWQKELSGVSSDLVSIQPIDENFWMAGGELGALIQRQPPAYQRVNLIGRLAINGGINPSLPDGSAFSWGFSGGLQWRSNYFQGRYFRTSLTRPGSIPDIELVDIALMWGPAYTIDKWFLTGGIGAGYIGYTSRGNFLTRDEVHSLDIYNELNSQGIGLPLQLQASYVIAPFMSLGITLYGSVNAAASNFGSMFTVQAILPKWYIED